MVDAQKVKNLMKNTGKNIMNSTQKVAPHKHCRICHEPISVQAEPRVCKKQECIDKNIKDEKNQKSVRLWMFIFFGFFVLGIVGPMIFRIIS
ncbi:MAG: DUF2116 family Zn-ribbon domain-containing protein [archaeon]|nr:DUF2116 family Zn-ribbon domain-containing protein [archaeon]MDA0842912.1 DUF2116 family Zn-ribbon domain-containing protein [archaeon]